MKRLQIFIVNLFIVTVFSCNHREDSNNLFAGKYDTSFYQEGLIKGVNKTYVLNSNYEVYKEFYKNRNLMFKGATFRDRWVGPTEFYDSNGVLILYNEIDLNGATFYVKKYKDKVLVKEEGVALSPILFNVSVYDLISDYMFIYAEPPGYNNEISVYLNEKELEYVRLAEHHIGLITLDSSFRHENVNQRIIVKSILKYNNTFIDSSSICEELGKNPNIIQIN